MSRARVGKGYCARISRYRVPIKHDAFPDVELAWTHRHTPAPAPAEAHTSIRVSSLIHRQPRVISNPVDRYGSALGLPRSIVCVVCHTHAFHHRSLPQRVPWLDMNVININLMVGSYIIHKDTGTWNPLITSSSLCQHSPHPCRAQPEVELVPRSSQFNYSSYLHPHPHHLVFLYS